MKLPKKMDKKAKRILDHEGYMLILGKNQVRNQKLLKRNFRIMVGIVVYIVAMSLFLFTSKAFAGKRLPKNKKPKILKLNFTELNIEGELPLRVHEWIIVNQLTQHKSIVNIRKHFRRKIRKSVSDI